MKKRVGIGRRVWADVVLLKMAGAVYKIPPGLLLWFWPAPEYAFLW